MTDPLRPERQSIEMHRLRDAVRIESQRMRYAVRIGTTAMLFVEAQDEVSRCIESGMSDPCIERARERVNGAEKEMRNTVRLAKEFDRLNPSTAILEAACRPPHPGPAYSLAVNHTEAYANFEPKEIKFKTCHGGLRIDEEETRKVFDSKNAPISRVEER